MALIAIPRRVPWRRKPPSPRTRSNGLAAGLLAAYPFHERAGSVITDVRRGKTGTLSDGTWTATERGYVYDLNGSSRYADISGHFVASDFASGKYTILCWAYARSFPSWATIFKNWATNKGFAHLGQDDVSNKLSLYVAESGGTQKGPAIMSGTMPTNKWFFVAAVADGANFTVYQDLVQGSSVAYNGTLNVINECAIGAKKDSTVIQYWNGFVDNVLVFNDALPFSAITAFYENDFQVYQPRTQLIFIPSGGGLTLTVADAAHAHIADTPALTQAHILAMQGADHPHTAESPNLTQQNTVSPQDALHGHTADSPSLTQANVLTVNDANHTHLAEVLNLVQSNTLTVADAAHGHVVESPSLIQAHTLVADDATHGHTSDGVVLQVAGTLIVQDTSHAHAAETPGLIQAHTLIVQDSTHGHTVESPTLGFGVQLAVDGTVHLHSAEQPVLTANVILAVQEALHAHGVDAPSLTQANTLIVSDALHAHIVDALSLILPSAVAMGPGRTILIKAQHRFIIIAPSNRFIVLSKQ